MSTMSPEGRRELVAAVTERYQRSTPAERGRILDEFVALTGYHRKHAIRVLNGSSGMPAVRRGRRSTWSRTVDRRWHPRFQLHFTPTSASWLNLVEKPRFAGGPVLPPSAPAFARPPRRLLDEIRAVQHHLAGLAAGSTVHPMPQRDADLDGIGRERAVEAPQELQENLLAVEPPRVGEVDGLERRRMAQLGGAEPPMLDLLLAGSPQMAASMARSPRSAGLTALTPAPCVFRTKWNADSGRSGTVGPCVSVVMVWGPSDLGLSRLTDPRLSDPRSPRGGSSSAPSSSPSARGSTVD